MKERIITAVALISVALPVVLLGGLLFEVVLFALAIIAFFEIMEMANIAIYSPESIIGTIAMIGLVLPPHYYHYFRVTPLLLLSLCAFLLLIIMVFSENKFSFERVGVITLSALYVGLGAHYVLTIRQMGFYSMLYLVLAVYLTDSGAYFIGRKFGKRQLAQHISPNKSIEGAIGGTIVATVSSALFLTVFPTPFAINTVGLVVMAFCISIAGQLGDLIESALKRFYHVKDSGNILPGHGGVLDRFDSILFGAVACNLLLIMLG